MEVKLLQEFDFNDKNSLFKQMDNMNDAIIKDISESETSLHIVLHEFADIENQSGEMRPYKELEIEYEYAANSRLCIVVRGAVERILTLGELLTWLKKEKVMFEMNEWVITSGGVLELKLIAHQNVRKKFNYFDVSIFLIPKKIFYRWMS